MGSKAVFVDTNIGTHIVVPVSPQITQIQFKGELERFHVHCCPEVGNITVKRLMVKKRSGYYELPESMPLKYLFFGSDATWFLHAIIITNQMSSSETESFYCKSANDVALPVKINCSSSRKKVCYRRKKTKRHKLLSFRAPEFKPFRLVCLLRRKRKRIKRCKSASVSTLATTADEVICSQEEDRMVTETLNDNLSEPVLVVSTLATDEVICSQEEEFRMVTETLNEKLSEPESVSGIIKKYFSDYDEVASGPCSNQKILNTRRSFASPVMDPSFKVSRSLCNNKPASKTSELECKTPEVGRRLLHASDNLRLFANGKQFAVSLSKFSNRRSSISKSSAAMRSSVFEIP